MIRSIPKTKLALIFLLVSLFFVGSVYADIYYVDINGNDSSNGHSDAPWKTISNALSNAKFGDTISINDGTYTEGQLVIPAGVSMTSSSKDNTKVILRPNTDMGVSVPFLKLESASPGSEGKQTISYIQLDGTYGTNEAYQAILVRNRNNVRIHNCYLHDFPVNPNWYFTVQVESTEIERRVRWSSYWPADSQEPGNDKNIDALWPANPVTNFEFDHNTMLNCAAIAPFHLKDSSFHNNKIDNRSTCGWCFKGTPAFLWNVDIYNNTLLALKQTDQTAWNVELWLHRNGCEYYNNIMDGYYSITIGKETKIYGNSINMNPADTKWQTAIEFNGQSYSEVFNNAISGAGTGLRIGADGNSNGKDYIVTNIIVRDNVFFNCKHAGIRVQGDGPTYGTYVFTTKNIDILNNIVDGNSNSVSNIAVTQHTYDSGSAIVTNINIKDNISIRNNGYAGSTSGTVSNLKIIGNQFYGNSYNYWLGSTAQETDTSNPNLPSDPTVLVGSVLVPPALSIIPKTAN